jgi:hypothetical protein
MEKSLSKLVSDSLRRFNYFHSLPRTLFSYLTLVLGLRRQPKSDRAMAITFSVSEDYARVWLYFARKNLPPAKWDVLVVDCSGDMAAGKLPQAHLIRFPNISHGEKIDFFLNKFISSDLVFIWDDDKYLIKDISSLLPMFENPKLAAISLCPRNWYKLNINGETYLPMGSYALLLKRRLIKNHSLSFKPVKKSTGSVKMFNPGVKEQDTYDTADYANEQLLRLGYEIKTIEDSDFALGFDGLSAPRIFAKDRGKDFIRAELSEAAHFKPGSISGAQMRGFYGIVKFEKLFQDIFGENPSFVVGFSEAELRSIVERNKKISEEDRADILSYFDNLDNIYNRLKVLI